jgi:mannose-1-phosphate guanylyltransferase
MSPAGSGTVTVLVLAAGLGTRLRPLTNDLPKPAIPLLGRPMVSYLLEQVSQAGEPRLFMNAHHRAEALRREVEGWLRSSGLPLEIDWLVESDHLLGTAGAVRNLERHLGGLSGPVVVANGDTVLDLDLPQLLEAHRETRAMGGEATLVCTPRPIGSRAPDVLVGTDGFIVDFAGHGRARGSDPGRAVAARSSVFAGVQVLEPSFVADLPRLGEPACLVRQGYGPALERGSRIRGLLTTNRAGLGDMGTVDGYLQGQAALLEKGLGAIDVWTGATFGLDAAGRRHGAPNGFRSLSSAVLIPPIFIGEGNVVGEGARLGPNVYLGSDNVVGAGASVRNASLWHGMRLDSEARLDSVIGGGGVYVSPAGEAPAADVCPDPATTRIHRYASNP